MNVLVVLVGIPLVARRESTNLITNMLVCSLAMGAVFGLGQAFQLLGTVRLIPTDLAAWGPILVTGTLAAWVSGSIRS
jgi:lipopolysaccharide export LptBFGC system permease protein LptF